MAILIASFIFIWSISSVLACEPTLTTVIGTEAPQSFCSGDLIFEDNFNTLDRVKWYHEQSMWGGGKKCLSFAWSSINFEHFHFRKLRVPMVRQWLIQFICVTSWTFTFSSNFNFWYFRWRFFDFRSCKNSTGNLFDCWELWMRKMGNAR